MRAIAKFLLWLSGWKMDTNVPPEAERSVMIAAPHTSNWDFWYMRVSFLVVGIPVKFTIKKAWMKFPLNIIIGPLGGLAINRSPKVPGEERISYVDAMAKLFDNRDRIAMVVTPEGSRKYAEEWKLGFYYTALKANVPITMGYVDYKRKISGVGPAIHLTGDIEKDLAKVMDFYYGISGKFPEKFSVDLRYFNPKS